MLHRFLVKFVLKGRETVNGQNGRLLLALPPLNASSRPVPHWDLAQYESERLVFVGRGTIWNWFSDQSLAAQAFFAQFETDYLAKGVDFLTELTGQFAFVVYDKSTEQLYAFRDQLGFYPLYWFVEGNILWIATHIGELTAVSSQKQPSLLALFSFFKYGYVPAPHTPVVGIVKLLAGEYIHAQPEKEVVSQRYWRPLQTAPKVQTVDAFVEETREVMKTAVARHLNGSERVALFLSGGLDSTILAAILAQQKDLHVEAFTFGLDVNRSRVDYQRDLPYARTIANQLGLRHHELILDAHFPIIDELLDAIPFFDGPQITPNLITKGHLLRLAHEAELGTIMTGSASTPAFQLLSLAWIKKRISDFSNPPMIAYRVLGRVVRDDNVLHQLFPETRHILPEQFVATMNPYVGDTKIVNDLDEFQAGLSQALIGEKMIAGHHPMMERFGGNLRMPYYDMPLMQYRLGVPVALRGGDGVYPGKFLLMEAFRDQLPPEIFSRKKTGYPSYYWYRGELDSLQARLFSDGVRQKFPFLDIAFAKKVIAAELTSSRKSAGRVAWGLMIYLLWHLHFVEGWSLDGLRE